MDYGFFKVWLIVAIAITTVVFGYALKLRDKLKRASLQLAKSYRRQLKKQRAINGGVAP
jgi:hypothetical protein